MKQAVVGTAILAVLMGLAACGQRGPLYLPDPTGAEQPAAKSVPAAPGTAAPRR